MSFLRTYRGEFSNTLSGVDNAAVDQVVRIDINQGGTVGPAASVTSRALSFGSSFTASPFGGNSTYDEMAAFFVAGKTFDLTGTAGADGRYTILTVSYSPPNPALSLPGTIVFSVNTPIPGGSLLTDAAVFTDVTINTVIPLDMAGDPLKISITDNDEDKFTPIKAKKAVIQILTNEVIDLNTFCEGADNSFYVEIFVDSKIIFKGYLIIPDMSQEFMPNPNVLTLTATDNLGTLKDFELRDFDNEVPNFDHNIITYIAWCLGKTDIATNVNVISSVRHGGGAIPITATFTYLGDNTAITMTQSYAANFSVGQVITISGTASNNQTVTVTAIDVLDPFTRKITTTGAFTTEGPVSFTITDASSLLPFYEAVYLDARDYEKGIGTREDCYTVLTKILGEDCFLFQSLGEWYIVRIDDMQGDGTYSVDRFDSTGVYIETVSLDRNKNVGKPDIIQWMNDDAIIIPDRAYRQITETFKYQFPIEIICNIDWSRGTFNGGVVPEDETVNNIPYPAKAYDPECWTYIKGFPVLTQDSVGYIKKWYKNDDEIGHYLFSESTAGTGLYYWRSEILTPVSVSDKFEYNLDVKYSTDLGGGSGHFGIKQIQLRLYADDGTHWTMHQDAGDDSSDPGPYWVESNADWTTNNKYINYTGKAESTDFSQWNSVSGTTAPMPRSGRLEIYIFNDQTPDEQTKSFANFKMDYVPLINGTYQTYTGQSHTVYQIGGYRAVRDKEVFISDAPTVLFKGALKVSDGLGNYVLAKGFTDANHTSPVPFGELQAFAVWNQYRRSNRNFDGELDLIETEVEDSGNYDGADLIHKYRLTDVNVNTVNRLFMVLHYEQDFNLLEWKVYIASLYRTDEGKKYDDLHSFKYLTS